MCHTWAELGIQANEEEKTFSVLVVGGGGRVLKMPNLKQKHLESPLGERGKSETNNRQYVSSKNEIYIWLLPKNMPFWEHSRKNWFNFSFLGGIELVTLL